ncbi:hypothetical protein ABXT66_04530 [Candidatus Levibacter sp. Uisw_134_01]
MIFKAHCLSFNHFNYESSILEIKDGLPKSKDFPELFGDTGEMMDE